MTMAELTTWIGAATALVAVAAAIVATRQLWVARRHATYAKEQMGRSEKSAAAAQDEAERADASAQRAHDQARWAWEQVKLASDQLADARKEHEASVHVEQWEWAYALTTTARELVDTSHELIRIGLDARVAPHYRRAADRQYRQTCQRWQDTMIKAAARISPSLELQHQVITFANVHQRLHGHVDMLLRAAETDTLGADDPMPRQVLGLRQELANAHRQLQRTISDTLSSTDEGAERAQTKQIAQPRANDLQLENER